MASWIAISKAEHAKTKWRGREGFKFASKQQTVEIVAAELSSLLPHYVFGFILEKKKFHLVALIGFGGDGNCYVTADNKWMCEVVPATLRAYPFALADNEVGDRVFCIDPNHLTTNEDANPLFTVSGELESASAEVFEFLTSCEQNRRLTLTACEALNEAGVIEPWSLSINRGDDENRSTVKGLYRISEAKLNLISRTTLTKLRDTQALAIAYAQLFSHNQLKELGHRSDILDQQKTRMKSENELGGLFNEDSALNFDAF